MKRGELLRVSEVDDNINFWKNNHFKWIGNLFRAYEEFFNEQVRPGLILSEFTDIPMKYILVHSFFPIFNTVKQQEYYFEDNSYIESLGYFFTSQGHPANDPNSTINKEKVIELFRSITNPFIFFEIKITGHILASAQSDMNRSRLEKFNRQLELEMKKLEGEIQVYQKVFEDKQEEQRKKIDNMARSYIETCEAAKTFKPSNQMLSQISIVDERIWKEQRRNEIFLKYLMEKLKNKYNQQKIIETQKFWWRAVEYVNMKIDFISNPDGFKQRIKQLVEYKDGKDYDNRFAKSEGKKRMAEQIIKETDQTNQPEERKCDLCFEPIEEGKRCADCIQEYGEW